MDDVLSLSDAPAEPAAPPARAWAERRVQRLLELLTRAAIALGQVLLAQAHAAVEADGGLSMPHAVLRRYGEAMALLTRAAGWAVALSARLQAGVIVPLHAAADEAPDADAADDDPDDEEDAAGAGGGPRGSNGGSSLRRRGDYMDHIARLPDVVVLEHIRADLIAAAKLLGGADLGRQAEALAAEAVALLAARPQERRPGDAAGSWDAAADGEPAAGCAPPPTGRGPPG